MPAARPASLATPKADFSPGRTEVCTAPDGERWTLRKLLRRFLWHDRIHARAMWRMAAPLWGSAVADPFGFR